MLNMLTEIKIMFILMLNLLVNLYIINYQYILILDRDDCYDCEHILEKLESIDEDTEALNIPLVKVSHTIYNTK